jgi:hypothetical protein
MQLLSVDARLVRIAVHRIEPHPTDVNNALLPIRISYQFQCTLFAADSPDVGNGAHQAATKKLCIMLHVGAEELAFSPDCLICLDRQDRYHPEHENRR